MSGIFDNFQASLNRGVNAVGRSTQTAQLNMQLKDLLKQRQNLAAQLGASLYEITKDNAEFRVGREAIYDGIAAVDAQRAQIEASIAEIKAAQAAETASAQRYRCPNCGAMVSATDLFCSGCGTPIDQIKAAAGVSAAPAPAAAPAGDARVLKLRCPYGRE